MDLKLLQKEKLKKQQKQLVIRIVRQLLIQLQKYQELHHNIVQKQLNIKQKIQDLIEKYQKKDICLQKKINK